MEPGRSQRGDRSPRLPGPERGIWGRSSAFSAKRSRGIRRAGVYVGGNYRGRDSVIAQFLRYIDETDGTFKVALQDVFTSEDGRAVGVHHSSAERNGKRLDLAGCVTLHVKSGGIVSGREHFFDLYAWDAFWS